MTRRLTVGGRRFRTIFIGMLLFLSLSILIGFQYVTMTSSRAILVYNNASLKDKIVRQSFEMRMLKKEVIYNINTPKTLQPPLKQGTTEGPAKNLGKFIVDNVAVYVDNTSQSSIPVTVSREYLIQNPELCSSVANLSVLVIVHTAPDHFKRRNNIRRTWTNETYFKGLGRIKVLFLLGRVNNFETQHSIDYEFSQNNDMLQGNFIDAYRNLTHKGVMAYKWISERCRNAKIVLKVDDDVMINTFKLFTETLPSLQNKTKHILCNHILPGTMPILREKKSKWYVAESYFRGQKFYPRYCSGFTVLITNDVIPAIFRSASVTPFFWVDDVYLYGLAPGRVPHIKYENFKKDGFVLNTNKAITCFQNKTKTCDYLIVGASTSANVDKIWTFMQDQYKEDLKKKVTTEIPIRSTTRKVITSEGGASKPRKQINDIDVFKTENKSSVVQDVNAHNKLVPQTYKAPGIALT